MEGGCYILNTFDSLVPSQDALGDVELAPTVHSGR